MSADLTTPYDNVLYPGRAHEETHPDRLAFTAAFYGMAPVPVDRCRILELGCAIGGNLIPVAYQYPGCQCYGIDLSARSIEAGSKTVAALGLKNVTLRHCSITDVTAELGRFDYIIAHGVYSWVPDDVREKILSIFNENLAPQGVAYVSYNAFPGSHLRNLVRDMMLFHVREFDEPQNRIGQARAILKFLADASATDSVHGAIMRDQWKRVERMGGEVLYHDDLDSGSKAFLLHEVVAAAGRHRLQYLDDATFSRRDLQRHPEGIRAMLSKFPDSYFMERDQYQDFIDGHGFRRTLLCHADVQLVREVDPGRVKRFYFAANCTPVLSEINLGGDEVVEFKTQGEAILATNHRLSKAALVHLGSCWPRAIGFSDLLDNACRLAAPGGANHYVPSDKDVAALVDMLYRAACGGHIELHFHPPRLVAVAGERPEASLLARKQVESKSLITNLRHRTVLLEDDIVREFLLLLDGTRTVDQLTTDLADRLAGLGLEPKDTSVTRENVEQHLKLAANLALLIA